MEGAKPWPVGPCAEAMWKELLLPRLAAGAAFDIAPYGTEALGVMRIEKGHAAGNELELGPDNAPFAQSRLQA